jgi:hypothetical protein
MNQLTELIIIFVWNVMNVGKRREFMINYSATRYRDFSDRWTNAFRKAKQHFHREVIKESDLSYLVESSEILYDNERDTHRVRFYFAEGEMYCTCQC